MSELFFSEKFRAAKFEPPTDAVEIPKLADFFKEGETPRFVVRGLNASEYQRAIEAGEKQKKLDGVIKAITTDRVQVELIKQTLGNSTDTPSEIAKRQELLVQGSVSPKLNHADAAKLAEVCPVEFYELTNKITVLTGQGGSRVKPQPSSPAT
jgi:hypothetical protein